MSTNHRPRHVLQWTPASVLVVCAVWTGLVAMSVGNSAVSAQLNGQEMAYGRITATRAIDWYSCAVFTPLFVWLARRWPIDRATWRTRLPFWLGLAVLATPFKFLLQHALLGVLLPRANIRPLFEMMATGSIMEIVAFWAMAAVILSVEYHDRWREREVQAHLLERQLAEARLEALTAQLQPHFLFNTLQGISTLIYRDTSGADRMLRRLSDLLRRTLHSVETPEVPLAEELTTLDHYLAIQRIRFEDRLRVDTDYDGVGDALVPHLILQPLVENAIEHGIARRAGPGRVEITAMERDGELLLRVHDDGAGGGVTKAGTSNGIGLANTRARLQALFGDAATLQIVEPPRGGFTVTLRLPLRRAGGGRS